MHTPIKYLIFKIMAILLLFLWSSCSKKVLPQYNSISEINATIINNRTNNREFIPKAIYNPLYVRVNFIFLLDENGKGNFNGNSEENNEIFKQIFKKSNELYANLKNPKDPICYKGNDFISDTKIQLQFKKMYVKDSFARNYLNAKGYSEKKKNVGLLSPSNRWYLKYLDDNIHDTITKKGINIYNTINAKALDDLLQNNSETGYLNTMKNSLSQFPSYTDFNRSSQINYPNKYLKRLWMENIYAKKRKVSWEKFVKGYFISHYMGLSHELGHSFGLGHGNEYHQRNKCFKAMMSQSGKSPRNYIQPSEVGKMHKALMTSNLIQFVTEDSNFDTPRIISKNENWDFKTLRFYQSIIVKQNTVLILNGTVIFPPNASIILEKNAVLILNNATLKTAGRKPFTNIIKKKHARIIRY